MNRETVLKGAKMAFFAALLAGYAGNSKGLKKKKTPDGYKTITFVSGDFKVVDRYCTTPHSNSSAGTTTIFFQNKPVWWMSYSGYYEDEAILFLKQALARTYRRRIFLGGRGLGFSTDNMIYVNHVGTDKFERFDGWESIIEIGTWRKLGYHKYSGISLI